MHIFMLFVTCLFPTLACGQDSTPLNLNMVNSSLGISALIVFILAYAFVVNEEFMHLRKSKPVLIAAGLIWMLIGIAAHFKGVSPQAHHAARETVLEYAELFLFLLVAMSYINAIEERQIFAALRSWLVRKQFSYKKLFWITGILAFLISPLADNMTTALVMGAIIMATGADKPSFIAVACINIVVAANAGGAFSPFGDITTLMVWQQGKLPFEEFFVLFLPALISFLVPAMIMQFAIPQGIPEQSKNTVTIAPGGVGFVILFLATIITAIVFHHFLHLSASMGMMMGLGYFQLFGYWLKRKNHPLLDRENAGEIGRYDIFEHITRIEWDTLLFFYGVLLCVGGLATFGYLNVASQMMYVDWGASLGPLHQQTPANIVIGILSALIDNIPLMFAVLTMSPTMSEGQWLLITLTAGIGGSLLSIGSAAGVALMGQSRGKYTFFSHLKWTWTIALGYFAGIGVHTWLNHALFTVYR